ncbi:lytic transglycosylase domain-containing protein [Nocardia arthritidis]|uniref:Transglycosylase SLT domain-containing protein n=1 Tax=Nocardia arthritidis TaxID=228602 RepID=A0A6G9YHG2_9NOCA|nr:lytic murein transglycosylase [Nocardia arthritidis]QIS12624.1 hypothetical protein F5544_23830 [Nocardia arthritidis]
MRISGPITASALVMAGLLAAASAPRSDRPAPDSIAAQLAAVTAQVAQTSPTTDQSIGLLPATPEPPRQLRAITPPANGALTSGAVPLHDISLPRGGTLGIPEIVLAAYRNAELALQSSLPTCGLTWYLLAGIGKIESDHASNGRTDADGTTIGIIYGPALDGTLPGNEVIKATDGGYVRAVGPMQFLPATWFQYASDGNGDGRADPNNVFDAALGAGKYLCSGGSDLRDPQQELQAILRYNNSIDYATQVLSWANAYRTGGVPQRMPISPNPTRPDSRPGRNMLTGAGSSMGIPKSATPTTTAPPTSPTSPPSSRTSPPSSPPSPPTATSTQPLQIQIQIMIIIPGLPPIPCGIFCVLEPDPADPSTIPLPTTTNPGNCQGLWIPTCPPSTPPNPSTYQTPTVTVQPTSPWYPPTPTTPPWYTPTPTTSPGPVPSPTTQPTPSQPTNPPPTPSETPTTTAQPTPPQPTTTGSAPSQPSSRPPTTTPGQPPLETSTAITQSDPTASTPTPGQPSSQPPAAPPPNQPPPESPTATTQPVSQQPGEPAPSQPAPPAAPPAPASPDNGQSATPATPTPAPPPTAPAQPTPIQPTTQPPVSPTDPVSSRVPTAATEPAPPSQPAPLPPNQPAPGPESTPIAPGRTAEPKAPATEPNSSAPSQQPIAPAPPIPEPRPSRIPGTTTKPAPAAPAEPTRSTAPIPPPDEPEP